MVKVLSRRLVHTHTHTGWEFDDVFGSFQQSSRFEGARRRGEWDGAACPGAFEFVQEPIKVQKKGEKKNKSKPAAVKSYMVFRCSTSGDGSLKVGKKGNRSFSGFRDVLGDVIRRFAARMAVSKKLGGFPVTSDAFRDMP